MRHATAEQPGIAFRLRRRFEKPRQAVFHAWTNPEAIKRWWCPPGWAPGEVEMDLRAGGAYRIGMHRECGGTPVYVRGSFIEVSSPEKLSYTWRWENAFEQMPETRVTVEFVEAGTGTEVVLIHEHLPEVGLCLRHRAGWIGAWQRIEHVLLD